MPCCNNCPCCQPYCGGGCGCCGCGGGCTGSGLCGSRDGGCGASCGGCCVGCGPFGYYGSLPNCPCRGCGSCCGGTCGACKYIGCRCEPVRGFRGGRDACGGPICPKGTPYAGCRTDCNCCGYSC